MNSKATFFLLLFLLSSSFAYASEPKKTPNEKVAQEKFPYSLTTPEQLKTLEKELLSLFHKIKNTQSYTLHMMKQQRVRGVLLPKEYNFVKYKKPFRVYMIMTQGVHKGREVMYIQGQNNNKLKVRERGGAMGFFAKMSGAINLDPKGNLAMKENKYPITEFGQEVTMQKLLNNMRIREKRNDKAKVVMEGFKKIGKTIHKCVKLTVPFEAKNVGYYSYITRFCYNLKRGFIGEVKCWNWKERVEEHYIYSKVKMHAGLTDEDFDPKNKKYNF